MNDDLSSLLPSNNRSVQVEQLKTHLRHMGGDDVIISDRHLHGARRPRPRPQHRIGERALLHRSAAPSRLSDDSTAVSPWSGGGGAGISLSGRAEGERVRTRSPAVGHDLTASPAADAGVVDTAHEAAAAAAGCVDVNTTSISTLGEQGAQPAPSPPRKRSGHQAPSAGTTAAAELSSASSSSSPSPVRKLRTTRLRSPTSTSSAEAPPPQAGRGSETTDSLAAGGDAAVDAVGGASQTNHHREKSENKSSQGKRVCSSLLVVTGEASEWLLSYKSMGVGTRLLQPYKSWDRLLLPCRSQNKASLGSPAGVPLKRNTAIPTCFDHN